MSPTYRFPRPALTTDVVLLAAHGPQVLLIRRNGEPFAGRWALPGGYLDLDEELEDGARRELREETGIVAGPLLGVGAFGAIGRDPRGRTITVAFAGIVVGAPPAPIAGDDAGEARWCGLRRLPALAFDHRAVVRFALERLRTELAARGSLAFLLPRRFTAEELRLAHEVVTGRAIAARGFAARMQRAGRILPAGVRRDGAPTWRATSRS